MKNLDNSLLGAYNLDESISNTDGQGTAPSNNTQTSSTGASSWQDAIAASILLTNQVIQTRNTPKNEQEQACGVKPLFEGAKMDSWNKCVSSYNASKNYTPMPNANNNVLPEQSNTNWWIVGGSIVGGLAVIGTIGYFLFRNK